MNEQGSLFDDDISSRDEHERRAFAPRGSKKSCAFCEIAAQAPSATEVVRTPDFIAFLDHRPLFPGHILMIPVKHMSTFDRLPADLGGAWVELAQRLQKAVEAATRSHGSLMIVNNVVSQSVPHLHLHIIPRRRSDGLRLWLGPRNPYANAEEAAQIAALIREKFAR